MTPTEIEAGNRKIAEFMGLELVKSEVDWHNPYYTGTPDDIECDVEDLKYHTSFDWFVPVWNLMLDRFCLVDGMPVQWANFHSRLVALPMKFTIETRLPVLLEIIEWLNQQKK